VAISKLNLMQTMNLPYTIEFDVEKISLDNIPLNGIGNNESQSIFETALKSQPQIKSATYKVNSAQMGVKVAKGDYMPRLTLFANVSTFYSDANRLPSISGTRVQQTGIVGTDPNQPVFSTFPIYSYSEYSFFNQLKDKIGEQVGLSLNIPIFNGRQTVSNVERNKISVKIAKNNEQLVKNQLRQTIEQASTDLNNAKNNYVASQESLKYSEAAFQNADKRYAAGVMNITDYIIQKNNFFIAQVNLSQAKYDYVFKEKLLDFYKGNNISF
jgi:outer membrane protein